MLNLYNNAVHSIEPDAGTIRVIVKVLRLENPSENLGLQAGEYVRLTVIDNGKGIAPEHLERMFDPFFTTKEVGKGTGLGLSVVHGIVERHNGKIIVKSQLSKGTTFALYFPTVQTQAHVTSLKHPAQEKNNSGQNKHILLVEDEETLINLYQQYLQKHGYKVTVAKNGVEALEVFTANPQQIDLVLTDQSMPKMTGKDLIKALFKIRPDIPVILSTGYSDVMTDEEALQMGIKKYLVKPIKLSVLERCIVECLGWMGVMKVNSGFVKGRWSGGYATGDRSVDGFTIKKPGIRRVFLI